MEGGLNLKLSLKHKGIEKFGFTFLFLAAGLLALIIFGIFNNLKVKERALVERAVYTTDFSSSRSNTKGKVEGVYVSEDNTRAFVLMKFNDTSNVSLKADSYQAFLTGIRPNQIQQSLKRKPKGKIYVFGTSGYFGVYLTEPQGFAKQILKLTIRLNAEVSKDFGEGTIIGGDTSYKTHDQLDVCFNPSGKGAEVSNVLSEDDFAVKDLYNELIIAPREILVREKIQQELGLMDRTLQRIDEFRTRLAGISIDGVNVIVPDDPEPIRGDIVQKVYDKEPSDVDIDGRIALLNPDIIRNRDIKKSINYDENREKREHSGYDKNEKEDNESGDDQLTEDLGDIDSRPFVYNLDTSYVIAGGYKIDWLTKRVADGYLKDLVDDGENYSEYLLRTSKLSKDSLPENFNVNDLNWELTNGKDLDKDLLLNAGSDTMSSLEGLVTARDNLISAWRDFYQAKRKYQVTYMRELINLDYELNNVENNFIVNDREDVIGYY